MVDFFILIIFLLSISIGVFYFFKNNTRKKITKNNQKNKVLLKTSKRKTIGSPRRKR